MALLNDSVRKQVQEMLGRLEAPVRLLMFTQGENKGEGVTLECDMCSDTRQLLDEIAGLSDKITLEVRDFVGDKSLADAYKIDKIPAVAVLADGVEPVDYGIRLFGIPAGYEFGTLIEDILLVGRRKADLNPDTLAALAKLDRPVHFQVFVTPT
jgi:alkyl hydroperoxide reductase subunit AhpF